MTFERTLARLEEDIAVPYPARRDLLTEIGDHLEALYEEYRHQGAKPKEARARAIQTMALDETFIASIDEVHASLVARALARLPRRVSLGIEYVGITLAGIAIVLSVFYQEPASARCFSMIRPDGGPQPSRQPTAASDGGSALLPIGIFNGGVGSSPRPGCSPDGFHPRATSPVAALLRGTATNPGLTWSGNNSCR